MSSGNNAIAAGLLKFGETINKQIASHNAAAMNIHAIALNHHLGAQREQLAHEHNLEVMGVQHGYNTEIAQGNQAHELKVIGAKGTVAANLEAQKHKQALDHNLQVSKLQFGAVQQAHENNLEATSQAHAYKMDAGKQAHRQTMAKTRAVAKLAEPGSAVHVEGVGKFNTALPVTPPAEPRAPRNRAK